MNLSLLIAYIHLLTLGIGFYAIGARANALQKLKDSSGLTDVFHADNFWGLAAGLWIITGLWRAFGGLEKGTAYYIHSTAFIVKMCLFLCIFLLEIQPMLAIIQWRRHKKKGIPSDFSKASTFARISYIQLGLLTLTLLFAVTMARGVWYGV